MCLRNDDLNSLRRAEGLYIFSLLITVSPYSVYYYKGYDISNVKEK